MTQVRTSFIAFILLLVAGMPLLPVGCKSDREDYALQCVGSPTYDCSYSDCPSLPGCVAPEYADCEPIGELTPCEKLSYSDCESTSGCYYDDGEQNGSCEGEEPPDCATLTDESACRNYGCTYGGGKCSGTTKKCENQHSWAACSVLNYYCGYTWGHKGCVGTRTPCDANHVQCDTSPGCAWSTCKGVPTACEHLDARTCGSQPGCLLEPVGTAVAPAETPAQPRCAGIPRLGCSSEACGSILGCLAPATGLCLDRGSTECEFQNSKSSCASVQGCTYSTTGSCKSTNYRGCDGAANLSESDCRGIAGCAWYSEATCVERTDWTLTCETSFNESDCHNIAGCTWEASRGCSGTPTPCSTLGATSDCRGSLQCTLVEGGCFGAPTECAAFDADTCSSSTNCSWSTDPGCTGLLKPCTDFATEEECSELPRCYWTSLGPCEGKPTPCRELDGTNCELQQGCYLNSP